FVPILSVDISHFFLGSESGSFIFAHLANSSLLAKAKVIATPLTTVKLRRASSITLIGVSNMNPVNCFSMSTTNMMHSFLLPYLLFCWLFSYQVIGHNQVASKTCLYVLTICAVGLKAPKSLRNIFSQLSRQNISRARFRSLVVGY
ncbi:hypothetical protein T310_9957, partial [Rasamsonia emersonii CBS 393.64]